MGIIHISHYELSQVAAEGVATPNRHRCLDQNGYMDKRSGHVNVELAALLLLLTLLLLLLLLLQLLLMLLLLLLLPLLLLSSLLLLLLLLPWPWPVAVARRRAGAAKPLLLPQAARGGAPQVHVNAHACVFHSNLVQE